MADPNRPLILIETKLNRPATDKDRVEREQLMSLLNNGAQRRLTLVSAPAGYGKTTLAAQWLEHTPLRAAWLSLDPIDDDLEIFFGYLLASLRKVEPGIGKQVESLLHTPNLAPPQYLADALLADLVGLQEGTLLVLDDFHAARSQAIHDFMIRLCQRLPASIHLVVLTREVPPWPLSLWRARQWINELSAVDLAFSQFESRSFFAGAMHAPLSEQTIDRVQHQTEGWVTALRMLQLSLTDADDADDAEARVREFSAGGDRDVVDYLMNEVIAAQPPEIREFLALTAPLDRFCAPLCDFILADQSSPRESRELIADLERKNLFLVPLDGQGKWFRYHHLFQQLLLDRSHDLSASVNRAVVCQRAGEWFAGQAFIEEALAHLLQAGNLEQAADLIWEHVNAVMESDLSRRTLQRLLAKFPPQSEHGRPGLLLANAFLDIARFDLAGMAQRLDEAESLLGDSAADLPSPRRAEQRAVLAAQRGFQFYWQGDPERALTYARRAIETLPKRQEIARYTAYQYTAASLAACGRQDGARQLLAAAIAQDAAEGSRNAGPLLVAFAAIVQLAADFDLVEAKARQMAAIHRTVPIVDFWYCHIDYFLGVVAYERNRLDEAAGHFRKLEAFRYRTHTRLYHDFLLALSMTALAQGNLPTAQECANAARDCASEGRDPTSMRHSDSHEARLALAAGKGWHVTAPPPSPADSSSWFEVPTLTYAELQLLQASSPQDAQMALAYIDEALEMFEQHYNTRIVLRLSALRAMALELAGDPEAGLDLLAKTIRQAKPHGLIRSFVDRGPRLQKMLQRLARRHPDDGYVAKLLSAFRAEPDLAEGEGRQSLSNREVDVLTLLCERLSNKQIASRLFIAAETVKKHVSSIYRKLAVRNRREAIRTALEQGLVPRD